MIPPELENLKMWIRHWNHMVTEGLERTSETIPYDHGGYMFYWGGKVILKQLSRQWAYDVKAWRMLHESKKIL